MKIKFTRNQIISLIIAFIFILYGLFQVVFKINFNKTIVDQGSFVLLIVAFILIMSDRKKKAKNKKDNELIDKEATSDKEDDIGKDEQQ